MLLYLLHDFPCINAVFAILKDVEQPGRGSHELIRDKPTYNEQYFEVTVHHYSLDNFRPIQASDW